MCKLNALKWAKKKSYWYVCNTTWPVCWLAGKTLWDPPMKAFHGNNQGSFVDSAYIQNTSYIVIVTFVYTMRNECCPDNIGWKQRNHIYKESFFYSGHDARMCGECVCCDWYCLKLRTSSSERYKYNVLVCAVSAGSAEIVCGFIGEQMGINMMNSILSWCKEWLNLVCSQVHDRRTLTAQCCDVAYVWEYLGATTFKQCLLLW